MKPTYFASLLFFLTTAINAADRPNIVFFVADDLGHRDLACYETPQL